MKLLSPADWTRANKTAAALEQLWTLVQPSSHVRAKAQQMLEKYDLRAGDAFQLAAALAWCEDVPQGRIFLTADDRLLQAAMLSGFDVRRI
jgi:predicted nucleic acid-binding protein